MFYQHFCSFFYSLLFFFFTITDFSLEETVAESVILCSLYPKAKLSPFNMTSNSATLIWVASSSFLRQAVSSASSSHFQNDTCYHTADTVPNDLTCEVRPMAFSFHWVFLSNLFHYVSHYDNQFYLHLVFPIYFSCLPHDVTVAKRYVFLNTSWTLSFFYHNPWDYCKTKHYHLTHRPLLPLCCSLTHAHFIK